MARRDVIRAEDVARAAEAVRGHAEAARLGAFVFDVLSRQAEGGALLAGAKLVEKRAAEHGVTETMGETPQGNILNIATRGADNAPERALLAAFAVRGLGARVSGELGEAPGPEAASMMVSFVRHADWFEAATPFVIYPFVDLLLDEEIAARVWSTAADACVSARPGPLMHGKRGAAALRVSALTESSSSGAQEGLQRIARHAVDPALRAAASFAVGDAGHPSPSEVERTIRLSGRAGRARHRPVTEAVRYLSGWAFLAQVVRLLGALVGVQRRIELCLIPGGIEIRQELAWLSRVIRSREDVVPTGGIAGLRRDVRFPAIHLMVGLVFLSTGVLLGGALAIDAARGGATWLLLVAAAAVVVGAGVDFALDVFLPGKRGRVAVELMPTQGRPRRVEGVTIEGADRFIGAVRQRLG